jgi:hypothetical protein
MIRLPRTGAGLYHLLLARPFSLPAGVAGKMATVTGLAPLQPGLFTGRSPCHEQYRKRPALSYRGATRAALAYYTAIAVLGVTDRTPHAQSSARILHRGRSQSSSSKGRPFRIVGY